MPVQPGRRFDPAVYLNNVPEEPAVKKPIGVVIVCIVMLGITSRIELGPSNVLAQQQQQAGGGRGQAPPPAPPASTSAEVFSMYTNIANFIARTAAMVPPDKMTWAPTPEVRSYARMFAHIVDDNNGACAVMAGVTPAPARLDVGNNDTGWAANKMTKADLEKALADSVALCNKAFASVDQTNMMEMQGRRTKIGMLIYNMSHINEHYGNLVTYLRLNGMVPPSSQPRGGGPASR
jgi:hypothetical protein